MKFVVTENQKEVAISAIPVLEYEEFYESVLEKLQIPQCRVSLYFALKNEDNSFTFFIAISHDKEGTIYISSHHLSSDKKTLKSLTAQNFAFHLFEREIHEKYGIDFENHPWLKPVRYEHERANTQNQIKNYPFYSIDSEELHEVGVGPIHAGVIEPGHFRFICMGEEVIHLEIQLGYQHKGIEKLFLSQNSLHKNTVLAESIAGDTVVGHTYTFVKNMEALHGIETNLRLEVLRTIALELERIGVHVGNLSALCTDMAYQLGSSVFGALRTPIINFFQLWCGNRFSRTLIKTGYNPYPFTTELKNKLSTILHDFEKQFDAMAHEMFNLPSVLSRAEKAGIVTKAQMEMIGAVGIPARIVGLRRDIRFSHPFAYYKFIKYEPSVFHEGDVWAHAQVRKEEIKKSIFIIRKLLATLDTLPLQEPNQKPVLTTPKVDSLVISLTEGWRGEIAHAAITDSAGNLKLYKVKDPSFHNWLALALAVRNNEISDFPICNKSFDLSYCGHDL